MDLPLAGKRVAVLVDTEFIWAEVDCYLQRFRQLGRVDLLSYLWGEKVRDLVPDIDSPDRPIRDLRLLTVDKDVADANADDYDIVIMVATVRSVCAKSCGCTVSARPPRSPRRRRCNSLPRRWRTSAS